MEHRKNLLDKIRARKKNFLPTNSTTFLSKMSRRSGLTKVYTSSLCTGGHLLSPSARTYLKEMAQLEREYIQIYTSPNKTIRLPQPADSGSDLKRFILPGNPAQEEAWVTINRSIKHLYIDFQDQRPS